MKVNGVNRIRLPVIESLEETPTARKGYGVGVIEGSLHWGV